MIDKNNTPRLQMEQKGGKFKTIIDPVRIELRQSTEKYDISDKLIISVIEYIDKHFMLNISIDHILEIVPLSRRNLEKKFKEATGTSVYQFILDKKIDYMSNELLKTNKSLLDITFEVGFNDVRNAYRIFKKKTGYSPMNFRNKFKKKRE